MIIAFTKNEKFWSRALMYFCDEPFSHVIAVFPTYGGEIYHASTKGVENIPLRVFLKKNQIMKAIKIDSSIDDSCYFEKILIHSLRPYINNPYDWPAYLFFGICLIVRKFTGIRIPKKNPFSTDRGFLCCEIFTPMSNLLLKHSSFNIDDIDLAMTTPYALWQYLVAGTNKYVREVDISELEKIVSKSF